VSLLDRFASRATTPERPQAPAARTGEGVFPSKGLKRFLSALTARETPVLLDLGPVVGGNVAFFGEELGCKIVIGDLFTDLDRHVREDKLDALPAFLDKRFPEGDASVDGVLCWDLLDYLDRASAQVLATQLMRILRPGGALFGLFGTTPVAGTPKQFTKYIVVDSENLEHRAYPSACARRTVLQNRDIIRLFPDLKVTDSFLLKNRISEVLFRKPAVVP
jgi:hypothetical protein